MKLSTEKKIINNAVAKAVSQCHEDTNRGDIAILASRLADKKGVNVLSAPHLNDIFCDALDDAT